MRDSIATGCRVQGQVTERARRLNRSRIYLTQSHKERKGLFYLGGFAPLRENSDLLRLRAVEPGRHGEQPQLLTRSLPRSGTTPTAAIAVGARSAGSRPSGSRGSIMSKGCRAAKVWRSTTHGWYDAQARRVHQADTLVPSPMAPQWLNRYASQSEIRCVSKIRPATAPVTMMIA